MSLYAAAPRTRWHTKVLLKFLEAIDLSDNLVRVTRMLKSVPNGIIALILVLPAVIAAIGFSVWAFYLDIDSSYSSLQPVQTKVEARLHEVLNYDPAAVEAAQEAAEAITPELVPLDENGQPIEVPKPELPLSLRFLAFIAFVVPFSMTMMFTAIELLGSRFAQFRVPSWQVATWGAVVWDLLTDVHRVNELMEGAWGAMVGEELVGATFLQIVWAGPGAIGRAMGYYVCWLGAVVGASYFLELLAILAWWAVFGLLFKSVGYWIGKLLAGTKWAKKFNRDGGFDDDSVRGGHVPRESYGPTYEARPEPEPGEFVQR